MTELLIILLQIFSSVMIIIVALLSLLIGDFRNKEKRYFMAKVYFSFGYFAMSWFMLRFAMPVSNEVELIVQVSHEAIRLIAPMIYIVFLADLYAEAKNKFTDTPYHGIERRHHTEG